MDLIGFHRLGFENVVHYGPLFDIQARSPTDAD
jgi:hypothetical protein